MIMNNSEPHVIYEIEKLLENVILCVLNAF